MKLYSQSVYDKLNDNNKELLEDYLLEQEMNGRAESTLRQYESDIKGFMCYLFDKESDKDILDVTKKEYQKFFQYMHAANSEARVNRFQSSLRTMLDFAVESSDYDYDINEMRYVKGLKKTIVREPQFLSDAQVTQLIDYLCSHKQFKQAAYVSLSYDSAGRRNEIIQVKKNNFMDKKITNKVKGKNNKAFKLFYFSRTQKIVGLWLKQRGEDSIESLWVSSKNGKKEELKYEIFNYWCLKFRKVMLLLTGERIDITPQTFRHSAIDNYTSGTHSSLKELGKDRLSLEMVQWMVHHNDVNTTQSYMRSVEDHNLSQYLGIDLEG